MATIESLPKDVIGVIVDFVPTPARLPLLFLRRFHNVVRHRKPSSFLVNAYPCSLEACEMGYMSLLVWCIEKLKYILMTMNCNVAARGGQLEILKWLREPCHVVRETRECVSPGPCLWSHETMHFASIKGQLEVMKWLHLNGCPVDAWACAASAKCGHFEALKWLRGIDAPWDEKTCSSAAEGGHLEILKWLRDQNPPCPWDDWTCTSAARNGHLSTLKWAVYNDCPWSTQTCSGAADGGHVSCLKWLREGDAKEDDENPQPWEPCPWKPHVCFVLVTRGDLETLKWATKGRGAWDSSRGQRDLLPFSLRATKVAVQNNHLEVLKWLHNNGAPCGPETCSAAAKKGYLEILKWLRSVGVPWDQKTCEKAFSEGHIETLMWAYDNGCPWKLDREQKSITKTLLMRDTNLQMPPSDVKKVEQWFDCVAKKSDEDSVG